MCNGCLDTTVAHKADSLHAVVYMCHLSLTQARTLIHLHAAGPFAVSVAAMLQQQFLWDSAAGTYGPAQPCCCARQPASFCQGWSHLQQFWLL